MTARNRASQRDFNRRRNIMLTKAFDMVFYQRGTNLSKCLLRENPKEIESNKHQLESLLRKEKAFSLNNFIKEKLFIENRWRRSVEPSILMERPVVHLITSDNVYGGPRYRLPMTRAIPNYQTINTLMLARPCMKKKFNTWEDVRVKKKGTSDESTSSKCPSDKERSVHFESAIANGGVISSTDQKDLFGYWFDKRVSSRRDDATRDTLIEQTRLSSFKRVRDPGTHTLKAIADFKAPAMIERSKSRGSSADTIDVFITQSNPNAILSKTKDIETESNI